MIPTGLMGNTSIVSMGSQTFICVSNDVPRAVERRRNKRAQRDGSLADCGEEFG